MGSSVITGKPYSATQTIKRIQTLADGTHITQILSEEKIYRDSEGRTRVEHSFVSPHGTTAVSGPIFIEIDDPVAGYRYMLTVSGHQATRYPLRQAATHWFASKGTANTPTQAVRAGRISASIPPAKSQYPHPETSREDLGMQMIEGINVNGTRTTTIFPEGSVGNDRPFTVTTETWLSPDLNVLVLSKTSDPRFGETTTKLTDISQAEPDPPLFQIPDDYSLSDVQQPSVTPVR